jgi:hypothetical protein
MNISRLIYTFCFLLFLSSNTFAQNQKNKNTSVEIIDFGNREKKQSVKSDHPMIIKTSPISPIFGKAILEVEREITDYLSLQVGVGLKFKPLVERNLISILDESEESNLYCESPLWENDICDDFNDSSIRKASPGIILSVSPRFFFESDGFEGSYIAPLIRYSRENLNAQSISENRGSIVRLSDFDVNESISNIDFIVHYGLQILYPKLSLEYFVGVGARKENIVRQDLGVDNAGFNRNGTSKINSTSLLLEGGIRIGFQL